LVPNLAVSADVGIGNVDHQEADAGGAGAADGLDPPRGIDEQSALPATRRGPELDNPDALLKKTVEQTIGDLFGFIQLFADGAVEAEPIAEAFAQGRDVVRRTHGNNPADAEVAGDVEHDLGLV
jgi:hypothetical protein